MDLSVVILNWNTQDLLEKCLKSLFCPPAEIDVQIIVVDNASEDDSRTMVRNQFPDVLLIANPVNTGFGAGNNIALPQATGRYVLFLNSDTVVTEGALATLVRFADAQPDIGILGPKLLNGDGSLQYSCRMYPNLGTGFFRNTPLGRLFPKNRFTADYLLTEYDHLTPRDVDWVSGAALMMRRSLIDHIGAFDEDYFMFCEDVDLCWRVDHELLQQSSGPNADSASRDKPQANTEPDATSQTWRVTYCPDAVIYHLIGKSTDLAPTRMTYEFHRSQYLFYKKHYAASTPLLLRPLIPMGIALRAVGRMTRYRLLRLQRQLTGKDKRLKNRGNGS